MRRGFKLLIALFLVGIGWFLMLAIFVIKIALDFLLFDNKYQSNTKEESLKQKINIHKEEMPIPLFFL